MNRTVKIVILVLIVILGVFLGVFIYRKTNIKDYVEQKRNERLENDVIAIVADRSVSEAEARVYLAAMKSQIESIYGDEVWNYTVDDEGTEYSELMKDSVLDKIIYIKLVCANAEEYGVTLTADDKLDVDKYVTEFFAGISEKTADEYDLTKDMVTKIYEENVLAAKVYDKITLNYTVDANEENCRQGQYVIFKINKFTETDGKKEYLSEEELIQVKSRAEGACSAMKAGNPYQVASGNSDNAVDEPRVLCGKDYFPVEIADTVFTLKDGEITQVLEDEDFYYVVYCENDYDEQATKEAIQKKITDDRNAYFNSLYTKWRDSANIEVDEEKWSKID